MALAPGPTLPSSTTKGGEFWSQRAKSPGLPGLPHPRCPPIPSLGPRTIFIACAPAAPPSRAQAGLGWNAVSLAPSSSFVYFLPCTQALPEPLPFSILEPNSNKAVTKDPDPAALFCPCTRTWMGCACWVEGPERAPLTQVQRLGPASLPSPRNRSARGQVCFITKNLLRKQNQCCEWDRKERWVSLPTTQSSAFQLGRES